MKNNLLTEIKHIKHLMGLNEADNQECEKQLEKAGYIVYNKTEQLTQVEGCQNKEKIKCVKKWMEDNEISNDKISINKHKGYCYIRVQPSDVITHTVDGVDSKVKKKTYTFWENGDVTYIRTFDVVQTYDEGGDDEMKISQAQFKGKYDCSGSDLKWENMVYIGSYKFNDFSTLLSPDKVSGTFMTKKSDGSDYAKIINYASTNTTLEKTDFD